ncbi:MAG: autotransporter-associated beta strand repeat-containing protein [Luteolibacter sp.]
MGIDPVHATGIQAGDTDVLNGGLVGQGYQGSGPFSVNVTGLAAAFPNGYVVQPITSGRFTTGYESLEISDDGGTTSHTSDYSDVRSTTSFYYGASYSASWALGTPTPTLTGDTVTLTGPEGVFGSDHASALAGIIITDKLLVTDVNPPPLSVAFGDTATLHSGVIGIGTLTYQWRHGGTNIPGATSATYTISSAAIGDAGSYDVVVTSSAYPGAPVTSAARTVNVLNDIQLWTGATDGNWDVATTQNWSLDGVASTYTNDPFYQAVFDGTAAIKDVVLNVNVSPKKTSFTGDSDYTLSGTGAISAGGSLLKTGNSKLTVSNENNFSGGTTVSGGTLQLGTLTTFDKQTAGYIRGDVTVNSGATLLLQSSNAFGYAGGAKVNNVTLNGGTLSHAADGNNGWGVAYTLNAATMNTTGTGNYSFGSNTSVTTLAAATSSLIAGNVNLRENNTDDKVKFTVADGAAATDLDVTAVISGGGYGIEKAGAGLMRLTSVNTFTGGTLVTGGTLQLGDTSGHDYATAGVIRGAVKVNAGATLLLQSTNVFGYATGAKVDSVVIDGGTMLHAGDSDNGWGVAYTLTGASMQTTGAGHYSFGGGTTIHTLASNVSSTISGTVVFREENVDDAVAFTVEDGAADDDLVLSAAVTGAHGLSKAGDGVMSITGACTYSGNTTITGGTLKVNSAFFSDTANVSITGGVLELDTGTTDTIQELIVNGVSQEAGIYGPVNSGAQIETSLLTGTGFLQVKGVNAFAAWIAGFGLTGADAGPNADPDHDGISNLVEFVLGGNPALTDDSARLPVSEITTVDFGTGPVEYLQLVYHREDASMSLNPGVEYGTNLTTWTDAIDGTAGVRIFSIDETATGDHVEVYIPTSLGVSGKLFARLAVPAP